MGHETARLFLDEWVAENVLPTKHGGHDEAQALAEQCLADAALEGIDLPAMRKVAGEDLKAFMLPGCRRTPQKAGRGALALNV